MDGWFLLSIAVSLGVSIAFVIVITDEMKTQIKDVSRRMDMLLVALEDCRLARISRDAQGKLVSITIKGNSTSGASEETSQG
jgi:hypothetical protein